jgi:hypothetical protein
MALQRRLPWIGGKYKSTVGDYGWVKPLGLRFGGLSFYIDFRFPGSLLAAQFLACKTT